MTASEPVERILIIRPSALGDVCRTVPVLTSLRQAFPGATIDWVVQDDFAPAIEAHPALNQIILFPRAQFATWWRNPTQIVEIVRWFTRLRKRRYDLVLDCQGLGRSGLMAYATGAGERLGLRDARELAWLGYSRRLPDSPDQPMPKHTVDQMLMLVEGLGIRAVRDMRLYASPSNQNWWARQRHVLGMDRATYALLAPTSRWLSKRWPTERFGQLIEPLVQRGFEKVVIIGSPSERDQVRPLLDSIPVPPPGARRQNPVVDLVGQTSIGQTMAIIAESGLVIANDSAPLHIAVGFDRPCVGLFGPTDPAEVGPYQRDNAVVRGYAAGSDDRIYFKDSRLGDRLMRFISTAAVIQRIDQVLSDWPGRPPSAPGTVSGCVETKANLSDGVVEGAA